jgi:hypothetical protein
MLPNLDYKPNLYDIEDMDVEEFRDLLHDMVHDGKKFTDIGNILDFGNSNQFETISHTSVPSSLLDKKFEECLNEFFDPNLGLKVSDMEFVHSKFYLHTQAIEFLKIDIISVRPLKTEFSSDCFPVAMYYEEGGNDEEHVSSTETIIGGHSLWERDEKYDIESDFNFDPRDSGYWEEWLSDFGIK